MILSSTRSLLLCGVAILAMAPPATAQSSRSSDGSIVTYQTQSAQTQARGLGISVSVDGEQMLGEVPAPATSTADAALYKADIQVKFDGFDVKPMLNIATGDMGSAYQAGESVEFITSSNYPSWITRSEIRISGTGAHGPKFVIPVQVNGAGAWSMPSDGDGAFSYVLRVYDAQGRYDETEPLELHRTSDATARQAIRPAEGIRAPGHGEDRTAIRNIPVYGGAVTIHGRNVPQGQPVTALGEPVPVDGNGAFVVQRILPPGDHSVDVAMPGGKEDGLYVSREVNIPATDWFYVGLADLTLGKRFGDGKLVSADPSEFDGIYSKGRLAFYLKGKIKGRYLLTASADTGEDNLENLLRGLDSKNPRHLLRRIDPDKYYPVYGDGSTAIEDAPTSGKFYVRVERGDSHVMWGNFKASISGSEYLRNERALYGANAVYRSETTTSFGERRTEASLYAAQPGTLPQRDVYRGTGGSAYFLKRQDISSGSETVTVEVRDAVTGLVKSRRHLVYEKDYSIDYVQGVIILKQPLSSTSGTSAVVRDGALGSDSVNLVIQYEYTPGLSQVDGYSYGGRGQTWIDDRVRVGVTGMHEETGNGTLRADQQMMGADIRYRHSDTSFVEAEYARSKGAGFGRSSSTDGGLTIVDKAATGSVGRQASAWRMRAQADLSDFGVTALKGKIGAHYDSKQAGFSNLDTQTNVSQRVIGGFVELDPNDKTKLRLSYEDFETGAGKRKREAAGEVTREIGAEWQLTLGVTHADLSTPGGVASDTGRRTDGGVRVAYAPDEDHSLYAFGQVTLDRSGGVVRNDRAGIGGERKITDKLGVSGEISHGTSGLGALAALTVTPDAGSEYYLGYRLDPERDLDATTLSGHDRGSIVTGAKRKYSDVLSAHTESNYDMFGRRRALTSTYGVTYTPDTLWTLQGGLEAGRIRDPDNSDFDRKAISLGFAYKDEDRLTGRLRGALGFEESADASRNRDSYLVSGDLGWKTSQDWQLLASLDAVISQSDQSSFLDGDYVEASLGYAYRPVGNDRLNLLFKYGFLYDLPGADQVNSANQAFGPRQRSHVLSADATYKLNNYVDIGGKYGMRFGDVEAVRGSGPYQKSQVHLGILRADLHVIRRWDLLLEGRMLHSPTAETTELGAVTAVYRHFGDTIKAGVGFNFGRFSDDLTDLTHDDQGVFLNIVGKY